MSTTISSGPPTRPNIWEKLKPYLPLVFIGIVAALVVLIFMGFFKDASPLQRLADNTYARGAITFIIMMGTICIAIILVLSAVLDTTMKDEQFRRGREVFGVLAGVLGTIVGFYFGASQETRRLSIAEIQVMDVAGGKQVATYVSGGVPPYRYEIDQTDQEDHAPLAIQNRVSKDGWIVETIAPKDPNFTVTVRVLDKNDATAETSYSAPHISPTPGKSGSLAPTPSPIH